MMREKLCRTVPFIVLILFISSCEEGGSLDDVDETLFKYDNSEGTEIIVSTGPEGQEKALENMYLSTFDENSESAQKELKLIEELGGFIEYEKFKQSADETYRSDMYEKHGLSDKWNRAVLIDESVAQESEQRIFCEWFNACGDDDDDNDPIDADITGCPAGPFRGVGEGITYQLRNVNGYVTNVRFNRHSLPRWASTELNGVRRITSTRSASCHNSMRNTIRNEWDASMQEVGHLVPARFGGWSKSANLAMQTRDVNQQIFARNIELAVAYCNDNGRIYGGTYKVSASDYFDEPIPLPASFYYYISLRSKPETEARGSTITVQARVTNSNSYPAIATQDERDLAIEFKNLLRHECALRTTTDPTPEPLPAEEEENPDPFVPPPVRVLITAESEDGVTIAWSPVSGAVKYNVFFGEQGSTNSRPPYLSTTGGTTFRVNNLEPGTNVYASVTAIDAAGNQSSQSAVARGGTETISISAPQNVVATAASSSEVDLRWSSVDNAVKYIIERRVSGEQNWRYVVTTNSTVAIISDLSRSVHDFRVTAVDNDDTRSPRSATASANCLCIF